MLVIGIISIILALFFLYTTIKLWPPGTYRGRMLHPSTGAEIVAGCLLVASTSATGIALISGAPLWWVLVGAAGILFWAIITAR